MSSSTGKNWVKLIALSLAVAIAYSLTARLSIEFATLPGKVTAVWLPSGMTLAFVSWLGAWALPGIALGSIVGSLPDLLTIEPPLSVLNLIFLNFAFAVGNCLQPLVNLSLIQWLTGGLPAFNKIRAVASFILSVFVGPSLSATIGITALCLVKLSPWSSFGTSWLTWYLASVLAHLLFTPPLLLWQQRSSFNPNSHWSEIALISAISVGLSWTVFRQGYSVEYILLAVLIWAVFRLGIFFTSVLVGIISVIAIEATSHGSGAFATNSPTTSLLLLQSFIAVCSITTLVLSALVQERQAAELGLERTLASLEHQVEERTVELQESKATLDGFFAAAPVGLGIVDNHLRYVRVNQPLSEINGLSIERHLGQTIWQVIPNLALNLERVYQQVLATGCPILNREERGVISTQSEVERTWLVSYFPILFANPVSSKVGIIVMDISDRKQLEGQLKLQARTDGLTTIPNRLHFNEASELEWQRCTRMQQPFSLILLDIDEFKRYNDTYGHLAGDSCLTQFAKMLDTVVHRAGDLVARYGGEEFVVMLPETDARGAMNIGNLIRRQIHQQQIPHRNSSVCAYVTASMGISTCIPTFGMQVNDLIQVADEALYESKQNGRDRITLKTIGT